VQFLHILSLLKLRIETGDTKCQTTNTLADRYAQIKAEAEAWNKKLEAIKAEIQRHGRRRGHW